jgi:hypothetical protein
MTVKSKLRLHVDILKRNCSVDVTFTTCPSKLGFQCFQKFLRRGREAAYNTTYI